MKAKGFLHHCMVLGVWIWCFNSWSFCLVSIRNVARQFFNLWIRIKYPGSGWNLLLKKCIWAESAQSLPWVTRAQLLGPLDALKCEADPSFILSPGVSLRLVGSKYFRRDICSFSVAILGSACKIGVCSVSFTDPKYTLNRYRKRTLALVCLCFLLHWVCMVALYCMR